MKIGGWKRLGIVLSLAWVGIVASLVAYQLYSERIGEMFPLVHYSPGQRPDPASGIIWNVWGVDYQAVAVLLSTPLLIIWLLVPLLFASWRWVRRGFDLELDGPPLPIQQTDVSNRESGSRASVMIIPLLVVAGSVIVDFALAKIVGVALGFAALVQLMLYAAGQSGLGYWVGWKMFRSGPVPAQWHVFGVLVSGAIAGALYLCARLFVGGRNMPSSESGWAVLFNIAVGLVVSLYLSVRLSTPIKASKIFS